MSADFLCPDCGEPLDEDPHVVCHECGWTPTVRLPLTRQERLEAQADAGYDKAEDK